MTERGDADDDQARSMGVKRAEWVLDAAARTRVRAALDAIDASHEVWPKCVVCGQRAALDKWGACSKTTALHMDHRAGR